MDEPRRVMSIMAHQDDFEFTAGGTVAGWHRRLGEALEVTVLTTTRGAFGHHEMSPEDTFFTRREENRKAAAIIGAEYRCLTGLDGAHLPGQVFIDRNTLGGLWNAIREVEPHVILCPPVVSDPRAGTHIDHFHTAEAVRLVAYLLGVPHAFPTTGGPVKGRVVRPLVVNVDDSYAQPEDWDVAVDVSPDYGTKVEMALCMTSQIFQWLPWDGGMEPPDEATWRGCFRDRHTRANTRRGFEDDVPREFFRFTNWGRPYTPEDAEWLFPGAQVNPEVFGQG
ncbi:MAG: PIG-L deacetylase family protein [Planctomycetota bacterium]